MGGEIRNLDVTFYSDQGYMGTSSHHYQESVDFNTIRMDERPIKTPKMYYVIYERPLLFKFYKKRHLLVQNQFFGQSLSSSADKSEEEKIFLAP